MITAIFADHILLPERVLHRGVILIQDGRITAVSEQAGFELPERVERLDAINCTIAPGFIDLHNHGAVGVEFVEGSPEAVAKIAAFYTRHGVTGFLAGIGGDAQAIECGIEAVLAYQRSEAAARNATLLGIHLEGPFINPQFCGAFTLESIVPPDAALFEKYYQLSQGQIRMVTLAPELPGAEAVVRLALSHGVAPSAGHSNATQAELVAAAGWGVSHITHTYNAMRPLNHREPGILGAALVEPGLSAEIIADGIHVHPAMVRLLLRARGADGVCLVTDSVGAAGMPDGSYHFEGQDVVVANQSVRLGDGTLCGSMLSMDQGLRNLVNFQAASLLEASIAASRTPARAIGLEHKGAIAAGMDADLVALDEGLNVRWTMIGGRVVYRR